jgi:hypothetical protein
MSSLDELFDFYREECVPAYSDVVGYLAERPEQFLIEIENSFSHIAQYFNPELGPEDREINISKAKDHLVRLTLDSYKLLWILINQDLEEIYGDSFKRQFCVNLPQNEFSIKFQEFKRLAQKARNLETSSVGVEPLRALEAYKETIALGRALLEKIDQEKIENSKSIRRFISTREFIIGLTTGFISGVLSSLLVAWLLNTLPGR